MQDNVSQNMYCTINLNNKEKNKTTEVNKITIINSTYFNLKYEEYTLNISCEDEAQNTQTKKINFKIE